MSGMCITIVVDNISAGAGFEVCVEASKSLILSCALFEGRLTSQQVADLSRLEVRYQVRQPTSLWTYF